MTLQQPTSGKVLRLDGWDKLIVTYPIHAMGFFIFHKGGNRDGKNEIYNNQVVGDMF